MEEISNMSEGLSWATNDRYWILNLSKQRAELVETPSGSGWRLKSEEHSFRMYPRVRIR